MPLPPHASFHSPSLSSLSGTAISLCIGLLSSSRAGKNEWWWRRCPFVFYFEDTDGMAEWGGKVRFPQVVIVWKHKAVCLCLCRVITCWSSKPCGAQGFVNRDGGTTQAEMKSTSQFHELSFDEDLYLKEPSFNFQMPRRHGSGEAQWLEPGWDI